MNERNKKIFQAITQNNPQMEYMCAEYSHWLSPSMTSAIYVSFLQKKCFLLAKDAETVLEELEILMELLSYLKYAEREHCIYIKRMPIGDVDYFLYEDANDLQRLPNGYEYSLGNDLRLHVDDNNLYVIDAQNNLVLKKNHDISFLFEDVCFYLFGCVYATKDLKDFIEHGFLSRQDYFANKSVKIGRCSFWLAIFVAVLTPFITLLLGNEWGTTSLKADQYEGIVESRTPFKILHDTVFIRDTVFVNKK